MKTLKLLILSLFIVGAVSCSSDDDSVTDASMTGKWHPTLFKLEGSMDVEDLGRMEYVAESTGDFGGVYIDFKDDGTYFAENNTFPIKVTVKLNGSVISNEEYDSTWDLDQEGTWERDGETVTISNVDGMTDYELLELTSSKLKMKTDAGGIGDLGGDVPGDMDMTH